MTGRADFNFPAFNETARQLRALGFPVLNPADFGANPEHSWEDCLRRDIAILGHAEAVILLDGYQRSRGVNLELEVAKGLGLTIVMPSGLGRFLRDFFDGEELLDFIREDYIRHRGHLVLVAVEPVESDDEVEYRRDRRGRVA